MSYISLYSSPRPPRILLLPTLQGHHHLLGPALPSYMVFSHLCISLKYIFLFLLFLSLQIGHLAVYNFRDCFLFTTYC